MVLLATIALFAQFYEIPTGFALLDAKLNSSLTTSYIGKNFTHIVTPQDWDNFTLSWNVGYCHPLQISNKTELGVAYVAFKMGSGDWPYITQVYIDRSPRLIDIGYGCPKLNRR